MILDTFKNNNEILWDMSYIRRVLFFSALICSIPLIFFSEESIKENLYLNEIMDYLVSYYPKIEYFARNASFKNLYYTIKLQLCFGLISCIVTFIYSVIYLSKVYLFSLGYITLTKKIYFNKQISDYFTSVKLSRYILQCFIIIVLIFLTYIENQIFGPYENEYRYIKESTITGAYAISSIISASLSILISYMLIELIAQIHKFTKNKK